MGKGWDSLGKGQSQRLWHKDWVEAAYRVLRPGGVLKAFNGTRTMHHMAMAMEEAGFGEMTFEAWSYGCLSEDTEILTSAGWVHYHNATRGTLVAGFDPVTQVLQWQPVEVLYSYPYNTTAYHLHGGHTDQVVSRNHRCLVGDVGGFEFQYAETLPEQTRVPVIKDVSDLFQHIQPPCRKAGLLLDTVHVPSPAASEEGDDVDMLRVPEVLYPSRCVGEEGQDSRLFQGVQRGLPWGGLEEARLEGTPIQVQRVLGRRRREDAGCQESCVEGWGDVLQQAWELRDDQARPMSPRVQWDGQEGWVRGGTPNPRSTGCGPGSDTDGNGASRESRSSGQQVGEPLAVRFEPRPQVVRSTWVPETDLVRVSPVHYSGVVWCVKVPTGAFLARRNGKVFITGNSGFPKSHNISKAIDKMRGAKREMKRTPHSGEAMMRHGGDNTRPWIEEALKVGYHEAPGDVPVTDEAKLWEGWGTALKPAWEPVIVGTKPS